MSPALLGRILAAPVLAAVALPPFANSLIDGYALRAADAGAPLPVVVRIFPQATILGALEPRALCLRSRPARRRPTARTVVRRARARGGRRGRLRGRRLGRRQRAPAGATCVPATRSYPQGCDCRTRRRCGGIQRAGAGRCAAPRPRVAVIATGGRRARSGAATRSNLKGSNWIALAARCDELGAEVVSVERVADSAEATRAAFAAALASADLDAQLGRGIGRAARPRAPGARGARCRAPLLAHRDPAGAPDVRRGARRPGRHPAARQSVVSARRNGADRASRPGGASGCIRSRSTSTRGRAFVGIAATGSAPACCRPCSPWIACIRPGGSVVPGRAAPERTRSCSSRPVKERSRQAARHGDAVRALGSSAPRARPSASGARCTLAPGEDATAITAASGIDPSAARRASQPGVPLPSSSRARPPPRASPRRSSLPPRAPACWAPRPSRVPARGATGAAPEVSARVHTDWQ